MATAETVPQSTSSEEERRQQLLRQYVIKVKDHREAEARVKKSTRCRLSI